MSNSGSIGSIHTWHRLFWISLMFFALSTVSHAQSTALLNGTVTDESGSAVPNATIKVTNQATGIQTVKQTDSSGAYLFPGLPVGLYTIEVSAPSFRTAVISGLKLSVATAVTENVQLKVGQVSEQVVITAEAPLVESTTTGVGQVINEKTVQEIPLNGRHFTDLGLLTPGTLTPPANSFLAFPLRGQGSFAINTAGQREDTTNWLVNGINLSDGVQNQITFQPPIDTLSEVKIDNSAFPAQYGRDSGAIANMATRSGTSQFHGEAFDFFRNNALDARNFFNVVGKPQAPFKRNDLGGDFGGPIKKNKLFFFLAYEGLRQHQSLTLNSFVPSQNELAAATPSPAVASLLQLVPAANIAGPNDNPADPTTWTEFTGGALANVSLNQGSGDLDFVWTQNDRVHAFYVLQKDHRQEPQASSNLPGWGDTRDGFRQLFTLSEDHIFSPNLTNTVRLGFNRIHLTFLPNGAFDPAAYNITMPAGSPAGVGLPVINVLGNMEFGGPFGEPQGRGDTTVVLNDNVSWLKGRHMFVLGGEVRRFYNNNISENVGEFIFTSMANFLNDGAGTFVAQLGSGNDRILEPAYALFAQDSFKWKPNFTFNIGLRYELNSTPSEARNRFTNFDVATGTLISTSQPFHTNNKNFEPRIGFAWDPFNDGKTSIRAAYAILAQAPTTNIVTGLSSNPPFALPIQASSSANNITLEDPSAGLSATSLSPFAVNPLFNDAYAQDWNLTVQRQLTSTLGLQVAYVGSKGTHLQFTQNVNQPLVINNQYQPTRPFQTLPFTSSVLPAQCAAPNPCNLNSINRVASGGNSNYNGLWITVNKHFAQGLELLASYTYSKSFDYNSLSTGETIPLQNAYDPRADYGPSEFDARNRFVASGFYQLPFQSNRLVSGWQLGFVTQAQSGNPITPLVPETIGGIRLFLRPDVSGAVQTTGNYKQWFVNKAQFTAPCTAGVCSPGNLGRNSIVGPTFVNTDFSVIKTTKVNERFSVEFRSEMFDIFNHPNFGDPGTTVGSSSFGTITSTRFPTGDFGSSRQIQFALKLLF